MGQSVLVDSVSFRVTNPLEPLLTRTVRGNLYRPSSASRCGRSVLLVLHGLSQGLYAWDFPVRPQTYSLARQLASHGYPVVAIDRLGYRSSDRPNGRTITVEGYAAMTAQIVRLLRSGGYSGTPRIAFARVGLVGHSAGTEIAELCVGLHSEGDALVATGYTHSPSARLVEEFASGDIPRALVSDYEYFLGTADNRRDLFYNLDLAESDIVQKETELAGLVPSGEIISISNQPSGTVLPSIRLPVLLLLAENDRLFPAENGRLELERFSLSEDKTLNVVGGSGHVFALHANTGEATAAILAWLRARPQLIPPCTQTD